MTSIRRGLWCPVLAHAVAIAWLAGTAAAQSPETSAASSPADNSDGSSGEREAARRTLFKRSPGIKWETDKDPKYVPWSGLTEEQTDPAKERRRSGLLDRLSREQVQRRGLCCSSFGDRGLWRSFSQRQS